MKEFKKKNIFENLLFKNFFLKIYLLKEKFSKSYFFLEKFSKIQIQYQIFWKFTFLRKCFENLLF